MRGDISTREFSMASETVPGGLPGEGPEGCRGFGISDAMILIAGTALALSGSMHLIVLMVDTAGRLWGDFLAHRSDLPDRLTVFWRAIHDDLRNTMSYGFQVVTGLLFGFTPAFFIVRLRRPRPSWGTLVRQPGAVAALAMVFGLFWVTGALVTLFPNRIDSFTAAPIAVGGTVALAWGLQALTRSWKPETGWIDRTGRLLGCVSIGLALLGSLIYRI
jgi:hypothetical protein